VATTEVPVLITGESGTGKELIARAIHNAGIRQEKPFVVINCGAIPENLMESELFGHEKGAFTGAHMRRKGRIELAEGGTLLLDEVGDLPLALQVKILRFLQNHTLEKVGGRESIAVDCRVIAATNRNIKKMVSDGHFREDLYFRLAVVSIEVPPLRKRDDDVLLLTNAFLREFSTGRSLKSFSKESIKAIASYEWPGNVRELQNKIRRAITLAEGSTITPVDLGLQSVKVRERSLNLRKAKEELEKRYIAIAMLRDQNNISKAAEDLCLARPTLHTFLKKYKIRH
jgi:two-component system NtrC family response regulator